MFRKKTRSEANGVLAAEAFPMRAVSGGDVSDALSDNVPSGNAPSGGAAAKDILPLPPQAAQHVTKKTKKNTKNSAAKETPKKRKAKVAKADPEQADTRHANASKSDADAPSKLSALDAAAKVLEEEASP